MKTLRANRPPSSSTRSASAGVAGLPAHRADRARSAARSRLRRRGPCPSGRGARPPLAALGVRPELAGSLRQRRRRARCRTRGTPLRAIVPDQRRQRSGGQVDELDGGRGAEHAVELVDPAEKPQSGVQARLLLLEPLLLLREGLLEAVRGGRVDVQAHLAERHAEPAQETDHLGRADGVDVVVAVPGRLVHVRRARGDRGRRTGAGRGDSAPSCARRCRSASAAARR